MSISRKLVYPFSIPMGISYACQTDSTATTTSFSNPNRFTQISNVTADDEDIVVAVNNEGGSPVVQFTGIHVSFNKAFLFRSIETLSYL